MSDLIRIFDDLETAQYRGNGAWLPYEDIGVLQAHIERTVERMKDAERERDELRALVTRALDIMKRSVWDEYAACDYGGKDKSICRYCQKVIEDRDEWYPHEANCPVKDAREWVAEVEKTTITAPTPADSTMTGGAVADR